MKFPAIFVKDEQNLLHWIPDHPTVARCGYFVGNNPKLIKYKDADLDELCSDCAKYLFVAIQNGDKL